MKDHSVSESLSGKVCVVTGGAGLLGKAFVETIARAGAVVIILDIEKTAGKKAVVKIQHSTKSKTVFFEPCDITSEVSVKKAHDRIIKKHTRIDAVVNNAYPRNKNYGRKFEEVTYKDFCENLSMHVAGYFLIVQIFSETMKKQKSGTIVNLGSIYGFAAPRFEIYEGTTMTSPVEYAAIKGAVINLSRYLASYLGEYGIRVNSISPGGVFDHQPKSFVKKYSSKVVLGKRMANPDDIADAVKFLISDDARYITGHNLVVDGGWSL